MSYRALEVTKYIVCCKEDLGNQVLYQGLVGGRGVHAKQVAHHLLQEGEKGVNQGVQVHALLIDRVLVSLYYLLQCHQP